MSNIRRAPQRDTNEPEIFDALIGAGASVERLNGTGLPDLLVGFRGETYLLEVKRPAGPKGGTDKRNLLPEQKTWWANWLGKPPVIVRTPAEALAAIGITTATETA